MKIIIDIPEGVKDDFEHEEQWTALLCAEMREALRQGTPLTKNEYICEELRITNSKGEKLDALLDKARMMIWCSYVSAEFAQKALGWKMEGNE